MDPVVAITGLSAAFVGSHLVLSHPPLRSPLVARLGRFPFAGVYSALSIALYAPLAWVWWTHRHAGPALWTLRGPLAVHAAEVVVACGVALAVAGVALPAPSSIGAGAQPIRAPRGVQHVTRHPVLMGSTLLAAGHLLTNGWLGDVVFLGGHVVLGVAGALHQDARMRAERPGYAEFAAATTAWPNPLGLPRVGGRAAAILAVGLAIAVAIRWAHRWF